MNKAKQGCRKTKKENFFRRSFYSHSVVPGGFGVRSYNTREMFGIVLILSATSLKNYIYKDGDKLVKNRRGKDSLDSYFEWNLLVGNCRDSC